MKKYICKICGEEFKNCNKYSAHFLKHKIYTEEEKERYRNSRLLKRIKVNKVCEKCGKEFEVERTVSKEGLEKISKKEKRFCSRSCGNGHNHSIEWKENISKALKGNIPKNKGCKNPKKNACAVLCKDCGKKIKPNRSGFCKKCWMNSEEYKERLSKSLKGKTGGYKEGSVKNYRSGRYNNIWFYCSWELAFYLYHVENNISIERNTESFEYVFNNENRNYIPDFIVNENYIEIKGLRYEGVQEKIDQFPKNKKLIMIEGKKEIRKYLDYVEKKYGSRFWEIFYDDEHSSMVQR